MKANKQIKLEAAGWKIGGIEDFLGLSSEEAEYIEMKLALSRYLKQSRLKKKLSQVALAKRIDSSQSRVAKMEAGDPSVSIDLLMKSILALGASKNDVAAALTRNSA
jgi:DNA-binding XRE family transcriptional regulator